MGESVRKGSTIAPPDPAPCPPGTEIAGAASSGRGYEQWCERRAADGGATEHGRYLAWTSEGWLREDGEYRDGRQHGRWTTWSALRKAGGRENVNGEQHGRAASFTAYDGRLQLEEHYRHGLKHGRHTSWTGSGVKMAEGEYRDGQKDGRWIQCGNLLEHLLLAFLDATELLEEMLVDVRFTEPPGAWDEATVEAARDLILLRLQERTPDDAALEHLLGRSKEGGGKYAAADEHYGKAIAHDPRHVDSYVRRADLWRVRLNDSRGTIAMVRVRQSSGYPDIDARVELMVAAVRRVPPLPQWFQGPAMGLILDLPFPDALRE